MKKHVLRWVAALAVLLPCLLLSAAAERGVVASGQAGDNATWTLYTDGELVVSGSGEVGTYGWDDWDEYSEQIFKVTIEDGITDLAVRIFDGFENPVDVFIGAGVGAEEENDTNHNVWWELPNGLVASFTVDGDNPAFSSRNGVLFNKDRTSLLCYPTASCGRSLYKIPDTVKGIWHGALFNDELKYIIIPEEMTLGQHLLAAPMDEIDDEWGMDEEMPFSLFASPYRGVNVELVGTSYIDPYSDYLDGTWIYYHPEHMDYYVSLFSVEDYRYDTFAGGETMYGGGTMYIPWEKEQIGSGTVTCDREFGSDIATITATPAAGHKLEKIMVDGKELEGNTFTMTGNNKVTVVFAEEKEDTCLEVDEYKATGTAPAQTDKVFAGWYTDSTCTEAYTEATGTAYAKFVDEAVFSVKAQITAGTTAQSEFADIRFLTSVDCLNYKKVGFKITLGDKTVTQEFSTVYSSIVSNTDGVEVGYTPAEAFHPDSQYFVTMVLKDIPNEYFDDTFMVTPYWVTQDGTVVDGVTNELSVSMGF